MAYMTPINYGARAGGLGGYSLSGDDEESLVRKAANAGLSGLGMLGNLLDLPGSVVRDALTWLPGGRGANPFDQLIPGNLTSSENRTSGRDLLSDYGLANPNKETGIAGWWQDPMEAVRDLGGFATEVVTDPGFLFNLGRRALGRGASALASQGLGGDVAAVVSKKLGRRVGPREAGMLTTVGETLSRATPEAQSAAHAFAKGRGYSLADYLHEPMRGLANIQPPFMNPLGLIGTGPTAQKFARFMDKYSPNIFGGEFGTDIPLIGSTKPLGMAAKALMHAPTMGRSTKEVAEHAQEFFHAETAGAAEVKQVAADRALRAERAGAAYDPRVTRQAAEGVPGVVDPTGIGHEIHDEMASLPARDRAAGFASPEFNDEYIDFAPRHAESGSTIAQKGDEPAGYAKGPLSGVGVKEPKKRQNIFTGIQGGAETVNDIVSDPGLHAVRGLPGVSKAKATEAIAKTISAKYGNLVDATIPMEKNGTFFFHDGVGGQFEADAARVAAGHWGPGRTAWTGYGGHAPNEVLQSWMPVTEDHFKKLADFIYENPQLKREGLYTLDPGIEAAKRTQQTITNENVSKTFMDFATRHGVAAGTLGKDESVPLGEMFQKIGMDKELAAQAYARRNNIQIPPSVEEIRQASLAGQITRDQADVLLKANSDFHAAIYRRQIPKRLADDYTKPIWNPSTKGTPLEPLGNILDSYTNLFKAGVLSWPSTKMRDIASGQIESLLKGDFSPSAAGTATKIMTGGTVQGLADNGPIQEMLRRAGKPVTDEAATDLLRTVYAAHSSGSVLATKGDLASQTIPIYGKGRKELVEQIPGATKGPSIAKSFVQMPAKVLNESGVARPFTWNPLTEDFWSQLGVRGVGKTTESTLGPVAGMERVGNITDTANRLVPFVDLVKKGVDPYEAMRRINSAQVSYDPRTFSAAERALKRLIPFYSYASRKGIDVGKTLLSEPGGRTAQTIRAINAGRSSDHLLPEHIADTAAIPLPASVDDGTKRYLTGLGLMMESPIQFVGGPRAAGLEFLSSLNPLLKGPLEWATGKSFFQKGPGGGRALEDLDPTIGRTLANIEQHLTGIKQEKPVATPDWLEALLGNLPTSRIGTTLRQLTDTRKGLGAKALALGSGINISDVSPAAMDAQLRDALTRMEKSVGGKVFQKSFIPEDVKAAMSPADRLDAAKLEALMNALNKRAKERREKAK